MTEVRIHPRPFRNAGLLLLAGGSLAVVSAQAPPPPPPGPPPVQIAEISTPRETAMVDVGGRKLACTRYGKGAPTVVLVSGFRAPQRYWNPVIPALAEVTTVVTYDRPGIGESELGTAPNHGAQAAADLHRLLAVLAVPKPYVVVGHSYGGRIARLFAAAYPADVAAIVLEDSTHEDLLDEQLKALEGKDREQLAAMSAPFRQRVPNPSGEADYMLDTVEQLRAAKPLPHVPLVVLAATRGLGIPDVFTPEGTARLKEVNLGMQRRTAGLVPGGRLIEVPDVGHNIHVDRPRALLDPLLELVAGLRPPQPAR